MARPSLPEVACKVWDVGTARVVTVLNPPWSAPATWLVPSLVLVCLVGLTVLDGIVGMI